MSHKSDEVPTLFATEACARGYQVVSFDLPQHGERKDQSIPCKVQNCVADLKVIMNYCRPLADEISLFACSMGAYFSLLSYGDEDLKQCLFLSPVVDMNRIICNMMKWFQVSEERLQNEKEIDTPIGQKLYWDYYSYVKEHPINHWDKKTSILYGSADNICEADTIHDFTKKFNCDLQILDQGEHFFHTREQLDYFQEWLRRKLI